MKGDIIIRPAFAEHAAVIAALCQELGYEITVQQIKDNLAAIDRCIYDNVFVAIYEGKVCGWMQVSYITRIESGSFCEITGLVVSENVRGKGIGTALVHMAMKWSSDRHCSKLRVRSNVVRESAHHFYVREGFSELKDQRVFECTL